MSDRPAGATRVRVVAHKWPEQPHWEHDGLLLGEDHHGTWVGAPAGTRMARPGVEFHSDQAQVTLLPHAELFVATFYARGGSSVCETYVDIATVPVWSDRTVTAVDLDLDVIRGWTGRVWIDDEDEFAAHRVAYGYPPELVELATASCDRVHAAVVEGAPPFDGATPRPWFEALAAAAG